MKSKLRKIAGIVMEMCLCAALIGCGDNAKVIEGEVKDKDVESTAEIEVKGDSTEEKIPNIEAVKENNNYRGYAFIYKDVVIEVDADAAPILEQLGEANSYFEAASCAFNGLDKMYTYSSFELDTYPMEEKDYVSMILLKDDSVATAEGVSIGDPVEKIAEIYGEDMAEENGMIVYKKDGMKLCFITDGESITSIEYQTTVLNE